MKEEITGKVLILGNNIDTDQIYPGRFLALTDAKEIGRHCLAGVGEGIADSFPVGGIVVAGSNFGCGSSREHAPIALLSMGAVAVVADSFARIFYRNSINLGLPAIVCKGLADRLECGQTISIHLSAGEIVIQETGETVSCEVIDGQALEILKAGGVKTLMRQRLINKKI